MKNHESPLTNGAAAAAVLAAGIGSLTLGLATILKENIHSVEKFMNFYDPVGPLSGDTIIALLLWIVSWIILHVLWKNKEVKFDKVFMSGILLILLGLAGTFPPVFDLFK
jgi:hypothetical protein